MSWASAMYRNQTNIPFASTWKRAMIGSLVLSLICVLALFVRGLNLGLDFEGGAAWQLPANGATIDDARDTLRELGLADARIQTGDGELRVRAALDTEGARASEVTTALLELTGADPGELSFTSAGASWGREITEKAVEALIVFFIVISAYITIRLRWQMAAGALASLVHDLVITVGLYALFQWDVTPSTVIAFLTIMGFSLYDTLVVFDKVRDNEFRYSQSKWSPGHIMELSLNQVFMRSVNTSITSLLPIVSVLVVGSWIMGATTLQEFGLALFVGMALGVYSSMFVAAPVTVWLSGSSLDDEGEGRRFDVAEQRRRRERGRAPAPVPSAAVPSGAIPPRPRKQRRR